LPGEAIYNAGNMKIRKKVPLFFYAALAVALIEILSFFLCPLLASENFSFAGFRSAQKNAVFEDSVPDLPVRDAGPGEKISDALAREAVHPYVGYVAIPPTPQDDYGFGNRISPVQTRSEEKIIIGFLGSSVSDQIFRSGMPAITEEFRKNGLFRDKKIVAVNLTSGGYKQPQQLMIVNYLLTLGAEFDLLINIDGFCEMALPVSENLPRGVFPAFPRSWDVRVRSLPSRAFLERAGKIVFLRKARAQAAAFALRKPFRYSPSVQLAWKVLNALLEKAILRENRLLLRDPPDAGNYTATGPKRTYATESELYRELCSIWKRSSLLIQGICRENGIAYFHFLQPNQYLPGSKTFTAEERKIAYDPDKCYREGVEKGYPYLIRAGSELLRGGVNFHDLTQLFSETSAAAYKDDCCHYNETGCEIFSAAVGRAIAEYYKHLGGKAAGGL